MKNLSNTLVFAFLAVFSALFIFGCAAGPTTPGGNGTQTTTIYGRIVDESGIPVSGATLAGGTGTAMSDANGFFIMKNAVVPQGRALVIAKKSGYFTSAHAEVPKSGSTRIDLYMMSDAATANVSGTTGGIVNVAGGATVNFAAGSFTDASGTAYTGSVKVSAKFLDPKNPTFFDFFDGDMFAQQADGSGVSLISSGVIRVELKDPSGNALKLDPTKPATLNYPKPLDKNAPQTMPLWYFDESLGMWKESGTASLNPATGMYTGTVTHFSDFNLDYIDSSGGFNTSGDVSMRIVCSTIPIGGVTVSIVGDDGGGKYFVHPGGKTGDDGRIHFYRFPANRDVQIIVRADKNGGLYFMNNPITVHIAPGDKKDLGDVNLDSQCPASVSGLLECSGAGVAGLISISDGTHNFYTYTQNGTFGLQAPSGIALTLTAMNDNGDVSNPVLIPSLGSGEQKAIGNVDLCSSGTTNYTEFSVAGGDSTTIALSPDGSRLATFGTNVTVYDVTNGNVLSTALLSGSYSSSAEFSLDGQKLLVNNQQSATLYDVSGSTATSLVTLMNVRGAKLYDDGSKIIATDDISNKQTLYSAADGSVIKTLSASPGVDQRIGMYSTVSGGFGYSSAEDAIAYIDSNLVARIWSVASDAQLRNFPVTGSHYFFSSSEDGKTIASAPTSVAAWSCYDTKTGTKIGDVQPPTGTNKEHGTLLLTQNYGYFTTSLNGATAIQIANIATGSSSMRLFSGSVYISAIAASRNEKYLAAMQNGKVRVWKIQ